MLQIGTYDRISGRWAGRWKDLFLRVYNGISEDRIFANAAGVTFYSLLALFPGIAALVSIYGLFADPITIVSHLDTISGFAPGGAIDVLREQLTRLAAEGSRTLGVGFLVGLVISLWSANSGIKALFDGLNAVYEETEKRSFYQAKCRDLVLYDWDYRFPADRARLRRRSSGYPQLLPGFRTDRPAVKDRSVADPFGTSRFRANFDLPVRPEPVATAMAIDHLGECVCGDPVARGFGAVLMVCSQFWELQQNLWLAWRYHRLHDLDVAVDNCRSGGRQAQRGTRAQTMRAAKMADTSAPIVGLKITPTTPSTPGTDFRPTDRRSGSRTLQPPRRGQMRQ